MAFNLPHIRNMHCFLDNFTEETLFIKVHREIDRANPIMEAAYRQAISTKFSLLWMVIRDFLFTLFYNRKGRTTLL